MRDITVCCIDYVEESLEAERRLRKGERQLYCFSCGRWRWQEECGHTNRLTQKEFDRLARRMGHEAMRLHEAKEREYVESYRRDNPS